MRASSHFGGGSKPLQITTYTSGSGNYTPLAANSLLRVTIQAPGGGGARPNFNAVSGGAGGGGAEFQFWIRATGLQPYALGAVGVGATTNNTSGTHGGYSSFGYVYVPGGRGGLPTGIGGDGGFVASVGAALVAGCYPGGGGGAGFTGVGAGSAGQASGFYAGVAAGASPTIAVAPGGAPGASLAGGGGGGSTRYGRGSTGGAGGGATGSAAPSDGTGYGGGGGGGGGGTGTSGNGSNGLPGFITVEDFGA